MYEFLTRVMRAVSPENLIILPFELSEDTGRLYGTLHYVERRPTEC
jgi:hypothetical protein